jgi:hypothetical protein
MPFRYFYKRLFIKLILIKLIGQYFQKKKIYMSLMSMELAFINMIGIKSNNITFGSAITGLT